MKKILLTAFLLCLTAFYASSQVYEWRGEGRKGIYDGTGLMTEWPEDGPEMLWAMEELPSGYSSPIIVNSTIYLTGVLDSSDFILAMDMNGKLKWQKPFGRAWLNNYVGSRCTPTYENDKLYVTSGKGEVVCLNAQDGSIIWKVDAHKKYKGKYTRFGLSESLLLVDNKVLYMPGGELATMIALDKETGEEIWASKSLGNSPAFVSPILIEQNGKRIIATLDKKYFMGVNPENGDIVWTFDYGQYAGKRAYNNHSNTPLYEDGSIYITTGYDHKSIKFKLADDLSAISIDWINEVMDNHHGAVVKMGDYIYGSTWDNNANGKWACVDWNTGETMYETEWMNKGQIIAAGDYLYCYDEKYGNVALVKPNPDKFELISSFKVTLGKRGPFWPHPVIDKGILYIRHEDAFMAYSIAKK